VSSETSDRLAVDQIPLAARPATTPPPFPPAWALKVTMAITGSVFVAFILVHLAGNLKVYIGAEDFNHYAEWLRHFLNPLIPGSGFLWAFRAVLVLSLVLHVYSGITLWFRARRARGAHARKFLLRRIGSRTMVWTGLIILCFIVFHLLDLTVGKVVAAPGFNPDDAYSNLIHSFERPAVALFYGLTMALIAVHVSHGIWSVINDLGGTGKRLRAVWFAVAGIVAVVTVVGNLSIPIAVQLGFLTVG
jgi:succinate dehydrogenase / fumarate reductase cytochrome b subunit